MIAETRNPPIGAKQFAVLTVGDHVTAVAEVTRLQYDTKNDPPSWVLYHLYDGSATIRVFGQDRSEIQAGDIVVVDFEVREGKPYQEQPQLAFKLYFMEKIDRDDSQFADHLQKLNNFPVIHKADMQGLPDGVRVKIFTKVLTLRPQNGVKARNQKVVIADVAGKPISLWLPKSEFPVLESLKDDEYFLLKAIVKIVPQNPNARFLSFQMVLRSSDVYADSIAKKFIEERIRYHSRAILSHIDLWKTHVKEPNEQFDMMALMLREDHSE